jgi:hypothetical protein
LGELNRDWNAVAVGDAPKQKANHIFYEQFPKHFSLL